MSKKRIIVLACILAISILMFEKCGYFPVLGKLVAKSDLEAYTGEELSVSYSTYNGHYYGIDSKGTEYIYHLDRNAIFDQSAHREIKSKFDQQYRDYLFNMSFDTVQLPVSVYIYSYIDANDYSKVYLKLYLLSAYEPAHLNDEESVRRMFELLDDLCANLDFNITSIQFGYMNLDGQYLVHYDNGKRPIMKSLWFLNIKKHSKEDPIPFMP